MVVVLWNGNSNGSVNVSVCKGLNVQRKVESLLLLRGNSIPNQTKPVDFPFWSIQIAIHFQISGIFSWLCNERAFIRCNEHVHVVILLILRWQYSIHFLWFFLLEKRKVQKHHACMRFTQENGFVWDLPHDNTARDSQLCVASEGFENALLNHRKQ